MGAGIAASPHCAERRICRCSRAWSTSAFRPSLTRSRSWLTSSGVASHEQLPLSRSPIDLLDCAARRFAGLSLFQARHSGTEVPRSQNRPVFRGPSWEILYRVPLRSPTIRRPSGAASRDRKISLPAPSSRLARSEPEGSSQSCRRRSDLWSPAASSCRCRLFEEAGTAVPITQATCTPGPSRESEK